MSKRYGLQCQRILERDNKYIDEVRNNRTVYNDADELKTDCISIKERSYFPIKSTSNEEVEFPIAYAKIVYKVMD